MNIDKLFTTFLSEIEQAVNENAYNLWFSKLKPISLTDNQLIIKVPMNVHIQTLSTTYKELINNTLNEISGKNYTVSYITEEDYAAMAKENVPVKQEDFTDSKQWDTNLNLNFNFDTFVVGDSNKLAVVAAHSVAEHPGTVHNPLFLYGKSGIGKTHLMQAIGNYISQNSDKKVLYTTSGDYKDDYTGISSIEKGIDSINYAKNFKNKYNNVDVLIVDDIQYLVGAEKSQQEFFNTFNTLYKQNKQIIISSDRSPDDLQKIEDRLKSRFMMGLPVDIYPPDFELRCKIIKSKIKNTILENKVEEEVIEYIANSCDNDVRFIEGTINRLMAYTAMIVPTKINLNFAIEALKDYVQKNIYSENSIGKIQKVVADYFGITVNDLKSKKKTNNIARPRHIAIYLSRVQTDEGLSRIGLEFGGRDHSTISASIDKITNELKFDEKLKIIVKEIKDKL